MAATGSSTSIKLRLKNNDSSRLIVRRGCQEMNKMKRKQILGAFLLSALVLIPMLVFFDSVLSSTENSEWSKVVFFVS